VDDEASYARALAFRRAAATLASLSWPVTRLHDVDNLPSVGEHSKKVVKVSLLFGLLVTFVCCSCRCHGLSMMLTACLKILKISLKLRTKFNFKSAYTQCICS